MPRRKRSHENCECDLCTFARTLSQPIEALEEVNGDVMALLKDGSRVLTPFFVAQGMVVN